MTKPKQQRDNTYYLERMKVERPDVFADYQKGMFKNASAALIAAGLRKPIDQLQVLKAALCKASQVEQDAFKAMIGCSGATSGVAAPVASPPHPSPLSVQSNRMLTPAAATAIRDLMARRRMKPGQVMREMGFKPLDTSLGMALSRGTKLKPDLLEAIERWLTANGASS